jgi:hypothetical protein
MILLLYAHPMPFNMAHALASGIDQFLTGNKIKVIIKNFETLIAWSEFITYNIF